MTFECPQRVVSQSGVQLVSVGVIHLNPIQDGGGQKSPSTSFFSVTSAKVGISPQNFLTFSFKFFATLVQNFKFAPSASPNYWSWTMTTRLKQRYFWSNPYIIEIMITSLTEMLELPNFGHMTTFTLWFNSYDKFLLMTSWTGIMTS